MVAGIIGEISCQRDMPGPVMPQGQVRQRVGNVQATRILVNREVIVFVEKGDVSRADEQRSQVIGSRGAELSHVVHHAVAIIVLPGNPPAPVRSRVPVQFGKHGQDPAAEGEGLHRERVPYAVQVGIVQFGPPDDLRLVRADLADIIGSGPGKFADVVHSVLPVIIHSGNAPAKIPAGVDNLADKLSLPAADREGHVIVKVSKHGPVEKRQVVVTA